MSVQVSKYQSDYNYFAEMYADLQKAGYEIIEIFLLCHLEASNKGNDSHLFVEKDALWHLKGTEKDMKKFRESL